LGVREFGIGSSTPSLLYTDIEEAIRFNGTWVDLPCNGESHGNLFDSVVFDILSMMVLQAQDLGLNRSADKWTSNGNELFTNVERQVRKRIWWACCITDK
jgi:hypothetical protein